MGCRIWGLYLTIFLFGCHKNPAPKMPDPNFIQARFNGVLRKFTEGTLSSSARMVAELKHADNSWRITLLGNNPDGDTSCVGIVITFDYVPKVGRHYFNNRPLSYLLADTGLLCDYSYVSPLYGFSETRYSMDGYVDVTSISRDNIQGSFMFHAVLATSDTTIVPVTDGLFYLHYLEGSDNWPGP
jgi:hypothetical protein